MPATKVHCGLCRFCSGVSATLVRQILGPLPVEVGAPRLAANLCTHDECCALPGPLGLLDGQRSYQQRRAGAGGLLAAWHHAVMGWCRLLVERQLSTINDSVALWCVYPVSSGPPWPRSPKSSAF